MTVPTPEHLVAGRQRPLDEPLDAGHVGGVDHRSDRGGIVMGVAEEVLVDVGVEPGQKVVGRRSLDE